MIAARKHQTLVVELEREYERRYGKNPSECDDDFWIDTVHHGHGTVPTIQELNENVKLH